MVDQRLERGRKRREELLNSGVAVVSESGLLALTHRAVAARAHVSLASVTYHFPSAEVLRHGVFAHAGEQVGRTIAAFVLPVSAPPEDMAPFYASSARALLATKSAALSAVFEMILASRHDPSLSPIIDALMSRLARRLNVLTGSNPVSMEVVAALEGLLLVGLTMPAQAGQIWVEDAVFRLVRFYTHPLESPK